MADAGVGVGAGAGASAGVDVGVGADAGVGDGAAVGAVVGAGFEHSEADMSAADVRLVHQRGGSVGVRASARARVRARARARAWSRAWARARAWHDDVFIRTLLPPMLSWLLALISSSTARRT